MNSALDFCRVLLYDFVGILSFRSILRRARAATVLLFPLAARQNSSISLKAEGGDREVRLTWTDARGTRGKEGGSPYQRGLRGTTFTDTNVVNDTTYFYYVERGGETDSSKVEATPRGKKRGGNHGCSDSLKDLTKDGLRVPDEFFRLRLRRH